MADDKETEVNEASMYPTKIKSVSSTDKGTMSVITNDGKKYIVKAKDTNGVMPKTGEDISKYVKEEFKATGEDSSVADPVDGKAKKRKADKVTAPEKLEMKKVTSKDVAVAEEVKAVFESEEFSTEQLEAITTVFEAAVVAKVNEKLEELVSEGNELIESKVSDNVEILETRMDEYLEHVVESWKEENKLAIERGIRSELAESFLNGMHELFKEHYVEVPEDKADVYEDLIAKIEKLEGDLNESTSEILELRKELKENERKNVLDEKTKDLSESQKEKMYSLVEGIEYTTPDEFTKKIGSLKEHFFTKKDSSSLVLDESENAFPIVEDLQEEKLSPAMQAYRDAMKRTARK